jgi:hypothetical protein
MLQDFAGSTQAAARPPTAASSRSRSGLPAAFARRAATPSNRHLHDVVVGGHQLVAHLQAELEADAGLLPVDHHVVQRHVGRADFERLRLASRGFLVVADLVERRLERRRKTARACRTRPDPPPVRCRRRPARPSPAFAAAPTRARSRALSCSLQRKVERRHSKSYRSERENISGPGSKASKLGGKPCSIQAIGLSRACA